MEKGTRPNGMWLNYIHFACFPKILGTMDTTGATPKARK